MRIKRDRITNRIRCVTALTLAAVLFLGVSFSIPSQAATLKEEVVYVRLFNDGSADKIFVVNSFEIGPDKQIIDYGNYAYVQNLTNSDTLRLHNGTVTINTQADRLYYEGFLMDAELPWLISIDYWLDGKKTVPEDLGGKSGKLKIGINTDVNPLGNRELFDKYCLQISITLDADLCRNIQAKSGTIALAGSNRQVSFLALPGKATHVELMSDIRDFEMPAITIAGIAMDMDMDFDDLDMSDIRKLADGIAELDNGVQELLDGIFDMCDGVSELHDGTEEFADGVSKFEEGMEEISDGTGELKDGVGDLKDGIRKMAGGAYELSDAMSDLLDGVKELDDGVGELKDGVDEFHVGFGELSDNTEDIYNGIVGITWGAEQLASGASELCEGADTAAGGIGELINGFEAYFEGIMAIVNAQLEPAGIQIDREDYEEVILGLLYGSAINEARSDIQAYVDTQREAILAEILTQWGLTIEEYEEPDFPEETREAIEQQLVLTMEQMVEEILEIRMEQIKAEAEASEAGAELLGLLELLKSYDVLLSGLKSYSLGMDSIHGGIEGLSAGISDLHDGLAEYSIGIKEYSDGVIKLYEGSGVLAKGVSKLKRGTLELFDGIVELKDGAAEFRDGVVKLRDGVIELFDGVVELHNGVVELHDGAIELRDGAVDLMDGTDELLDGTYDLYDGVAEIKDGMGKIRENTATLDTDIIDGIKKTVEDMFGRDIPTKSFVSENNGEINAVQFVMQTEGISTPGTEKIESALKPGLNFWQRFWQLFIRLFGFGGDER